MTTVAVLALVACLLGWLVKRLVSSGAATAAAEQQVDAAALRVAGKSAAIRVLEQLDVSGSRQASPPSSS